MFLLSVFAVTFLSGESLKMFFLSIYLSLKLQYLNSHKINAVGVCRGLYVDESYPYDFGPLNVSTFTYSPSLRPLNPPVMRTKSEQDSLFLSIATSQILVKYCECCLTSVCSDSSGRVRCLLLRHWSRWNHSWRFLR